MRSKRAQREYAKMVRDECHRIVESGEYRRMVQDEVRRLTKQEQADQMWSNAHVDPKTGERI